MNIKVQRQKPNRREGAQGEMRLIIMARGTYLYIKGGNQWHTLNLSPSEERDQVSRRKRGNLQRDILFVTEREGDTAGTYGGANADGNLDGGNIMNPGGTNSGAALKDEPT